MARLDKLEAKEYWLLTGKTVIPFKVLSVVPSKLAKGSS
jgi:hypothetical protein